MPESKSHKIVIMDTWRDYDMTVDSKAFLVRVLVYVRSRNTDSRKGSFELD